MAEIMFERLVGRSLARFVSRELDLAGSRMTVNNFIEIAIIGWVVIIAVMAFFLDLILKIGPGFAFLGALVISVVYELLLYAILEFQIEQRKNFVEDILPDYLQLVAANVKSGVAFSKAIIISARPEFKYFSNDLQNLSRQLYAGETMASALAQLGNRYRSTTLSRTLRLIMEAVQYGGGIGDLLNQIAKDERNQQIIRKEINGQLFMYTLFIAFAALVGAPALYGLTNELIAVTSKIWSQISIGTLTSVPSGSLSFLKFSKPQITPQNYYDFSLAAILVITGFAAFIISAISTGSVTQGIKYLPVFIIMGLLVFFIVSSFMAGMFASIAG